MELKVVPYKPDRDGGFDDDDFDDDDDGEIFGLDAGEAVIGLIAVAALILALEKSRPSIAGPLDFAPDFGL